MLLLLVQFMLDVVIFHIVHPERGPAAVSESGARGQPEIMNFLGLTDKRSLALQANLLFIDHRKTILHVLSWSRHRQPLLMTAKTFRLFHHPQGLPSPYFFRRFGWGDFVRSWSYFLTFDLFAFVKRG